MAWTLFYFLLALFILVTFHEAGHFLCARALGVKVLRFSFGFGQVLFRWRDRRGTEYAWSLLPLGGYVKMLDETEDDVSFEERHQAFNTQPVWVRMLIVFAGPLSNFLLAWGLLTLALMMGLPSVTPTLPVLKTVEHVTPAARAGLMAGDRIVAVDAQPIHDWVALANYIRARPDQHVALDVIRGHQEKHIMIQLEHKMIDGHQQGWLGVQAHVTDKQIVIHHESFWDATQLAWKKTLQLTKETFALVGHVIQGTQTLQQLSGPVGIAHYAGLSAREGTAYYLFFLALISVSLSVLNVLPIPMLDGGHLVYCVLEIIMRRPVSARVQSIGMYVGFAVLATLMVVAIGNDLTHLHVITP